MELETHGTHYRTGQHADTQYDSTRPPGVVIPPRVHSPREENEEEKVGAEYRRYEDTEYDGEAFGCYEVVIVQEGRSAKANDSSIHICGYVWWVDAPLGVSLYVLLEVLVFREGVCRGTFGSETYKHGELVKYEAFSAPWPASVEHVP